MRQHQTALRPIPRWSWSTGAAPTPTSKGLSLTEQHLAQLGLRGAGRQLPGRFRLRARVPGSGRGGLGQWTGARRGRCRRLPAGAALVEREGRHLRLQLRGHPEHGRGRPRARRLRRPARCPWRGSTTSPTPTPTRTGWGKIFIRTGHGGPARGPPRSLRHQQHPGARVRTWSRPPSSCTGKKTCVPRIGSTNSRWRSLTGKGKVFESHSYPGEPHGFRDPMNRGGHVSQARSVVRSLAEGGCAGVRSPPRRGTGAPVWPGEEWAVSTPEAEGLDPAAIDSLIADIDAGRFRAHRPLPAHSSRAT